MIFTGSDSETLEGLDQILDLGGFWILLKFSKVDFSTFLGVFRYRARNWGSKMTPLWVQIFELLQFIFTEATVKLSLLKVRFWGEGILALPQDSGPGPGQAWDKMAQKGLF